MLTPLLYTLFNLVTLAIDGCALFLAFQMQKNLRAAFAPLALSLSISIVLIATSMLFFNQFTGLNRPQWYSIFSLVSLLLGQGSHLLMLVAVFSSREQVREDQA